MKKILLVRGMEATHIFCGTWANRRSLDDTALRSQHLCTSSGSPDACGIVGRYGWLIVITDQRSARPLLGPSALILPFHCQLCLKGCPSSFAPWRHCPRPRTHIVPYAACRAHQPADHLEITHRRSFLSRTRLPTQYSSDRLAAARLYLQPSTESHLPALPWSRTEQGLIGRRDVQQLLESVLVIRHGLRRALSPLRCFLFTVPPSTAASKTAPGTGTR